MDETNLVDAITTAATNPNIQDAFNSGLQFGVLVFVGVMGIAMVRNMVNDDREGE